MSRSNYVTRRAFGAILGGAALAAPGIARAQARNISVQISAIYRKSFESYVVPKMKELHNVDVAFP